MNTKNTPKRAWSRPYCGVSHLKETIKKGYQVSITHSPADDTFDGGYDWAIIALDGFCSIAEGTEASLEAARRSAEAEAERMRLIERSPNMAHTPGPWTAGEEFCINPRPIGDGRRYDGLILVGFAFVMDSARDRKEVIANQNLMAAAPDLLAALEACLLREDVADDELGDMIRATIAKATGGAK